MVWHPLPSVDQYQIASLHSLRIFFSADNALAGDPCHWVALGQDHLLLEQGSGASVPAKWLNARRVEVLLPADRVLLAWLDIPESQRRNLPKLLPFCLEDRSLLPPEQCHIAAAARCTAFGWPVAMVARDWLAASLKLLTTNGVRPTAVFSEADCLPIDTTVWQGAVIQSDIVVRTPSGLVRFDADAEQWPVSLSLALRKSSTPPEKLLVHLPAGVDGAEQAAWAAQGPVPVEWRAGWDWRSASLCPERVNLLQQGFGHSALSRIDWPQVRVPAILAGLLALVAALGVVADWWMLSRQSRALEREVELAARRVITAGPLIDPVTQVQRALQAKTNQGGFLSMAEQIAPLVAPARLESLRFSSGGMAIRVAAVEGAQLDALAGRLRAAGLAVEQRAIESGTSWELIIKRGG